MRIPIAVFHEGEEGATTVVCDDGSVWAMHFGDNGPDGWNEEIPIPGTQRAVELTGDGDTTASSQPVCPRCKGWGILLGESDAPI